MQAFEGKPVAEATEAPREKRRILIFADGTGNAFRLQESNIWRLYKALDVGVCDDGVVQIARYIPGVGTSSVGVIRMLDGAIGFGVPSNVRKLYRFLCWNWREGDEIYLFGFSRGAFTVRTLAAMIRFQGLMPRERKGETVSDAEMKRNVRAAWNGYRRATAPLWQDGKLQMAPWIGWIRDLRDGIGAGLRWMRGIDQHQTVRRQMPATRRPPPEVFGEPDEFSEPADYVKVRYLGLFDTVEAYGMPFEGLRGLFSRLVWPITFRNRFCSMIVGRADHLLALDDERLTFHPIRFNQSKQGQPDAPTLIREIWFPGVHSDIGGGYPDDTVAMDPLVWMASAAAAEGVRFRPDLIGGYARERTPQALIHDSRASVGAVYRYRPRPKDTGAEHGDLVLHTSVREKIGRGFYGYAPLFLPDRVQEVGDPQGWDAAVAAEGLALQKDRTAEAAVARLVTKRVRNNLAQIAVAFIFVLLPLLNYFDAAQWSEVSLSRLWVGTKWLAGAWWKAIFLDFSRLWHMYLAVWPWAVFVLALAGLLHGQMLSLGYRIRDAATAVFKAR